jgi:hypothetical protein
VFENRVLRSLVVSKRDNVTGGKENYSTPKCNWNDQIKEKRWEGHVAHIEERRNAYRILVRKTPLGRPRSMW